MVIAECVGKGEEHLRSLLVLVGGDRSSCSTRGDCVGLRGARWLLGEVKGIDTSLTAAGVGVRVARWLL